MTQVFLVERMCVGEVDTPRSRLGKAHPELFPFEVCTVGPGQPCSSCGGPSFRIHRASARKAERMFGMEPDEFITRTVCERQGHFA
jgi:hypothetical protein